MKNSPIAIILKKFILKILGPQPKFKKGDSVQCVSGKDLMVVQGAKVLKKSVITYSCKWYDSQARSVRTNIFREEQLVQFDWYHPE